MKLVILYGYLLNPATNQEGICDILIEDGRIKRMETSLPSEVIREADQVIDAEGKYVMPGFIDLHVHLREPGFEYKETIHTGSLAAAKGGFTTICPMPNTKPATDTPEKISALIEKAKKDSVVHIAPIGAITKNQDGLELTDIAGMKKAGARAISEDGKSGMETSLYRRAMKEAKQAEIPIFAHCEERSLVEHGVMNAGETARKFGLLGITNAVEDVIVARDILMAKETGAQLHLCHCSTSDSVELVSMAKKQGLFVTAEVCPHHFTLADEDIIVDHGDYKMNPPLRSRADVQALKNGLKQNIMDAIATDHAPHSEEENNQSMKLAPFGIVGLETAFALTVTELVKPGYLTLMQMVEKLSVNPAKILHIPKGDISVGNVADLVVADLDTVYHIDKNTFVSKGKNTPFHGKKVSGMVLYTLVDGKIVYQS